MAIPFPSEAWIKMAMDEVNKSLAYRDAAATWEGDLVFVVTAIPGKTEPVQLYMDLWHGECRDAFRVKDGSGQKSEFVITAPLLVWREVIEGRLDPIRGLMSRKLRMKGNMMKVIKSPKAAIELVNCCTNIETSWP